MAATVYGGLTVACGDGDALVAVSLPVPASLVWVALIPEVTGSTSEARAVTALVQRAHRRMLGRHSFDIGLRERMHLFVAEGVEDGDASPEADEDLELVRWHVGEIGNRLAEIEDAKTLAGLLLYLRKVG